MRFRDKTTTITIPEDATNGEAIKLLFPNGHYSEGRKKVYYNFYPYGCMEFDKTWWNAPYVHS